MHLKIGRTERTVAVTIGFKSWTPPDYMPTVKPLASRTSSTSVMSPDLSIPKKFLNSGYMRKTRKGGDESL